MRVTHILDHHGGGDPLRYSKAEIQNESVGAAATLVAEHFESSGTAVPESIAQLLQAAIVSNTLNFLAPATSDRDRAAYAGLRSIAPLGEIVMEQMRAARRSALLADVELVIGEDTKVFETPFGKVIVSQVEAPGALELLERPTLSKALQELARRSNAASAVANLVDTTLVRSAILATDARILNVLAERLRLAPTGDGVILIDRLAQRKTDIVPHLAMTNA
jgi:manganese-dependent inorganic pyrophosphatase